MLLRTLGALMLGNIFTGKSLMRAGRGYNNITRLMVF